MKRKIFFAVTIAICTSGSFAAEPGISFAARGVAPESITQQVAQSWSCSPRKTCTRIRTCDEAVWYHRNCSWGGRLDGDNDGVPCESICR